MKLIDNHGRPIQYLRLAIIDRCNLRCFYCMPEEGIAFIKREELLTYEEMERLVAIFGDLGVTKLRLTGGEPFLRRDFIPFLERLSTIQTINTISITTNGVLTHNYIDDLIRLNINTINLSLDTLDRDRFFQITRRDNYDDVMKTLDLLLKNGFKVKINAVIMQGVNEIDITPLAGLTRGEPVEMRFIEEMPFNGSGARVKKLNWNHTAILDELKVHYPSIRPSITPEFSTATLYEIDGHKGSIGIIPAYSRTFCGQCDRVRITAQGHMKTCLYDDGVADLKKIIREGATDDDLKQLIIHCLTHRAKDGFEAEKNRAKSTDITESMSTIGG